MKKTFVRIISLLLVLIMAFSLIPTSVFNASAATSGSCGDKLTWSYDEETCSLTISGTGAMTEYRYNSDVPWYNYNDNIKSVAIGDGVSTISRNAFYFCKSLYKITIPDSVTSIGEYAFYDCDSLTSVTIPDSVTSIGKDAFYGCNNLTSITIPDSVTSIGEYAFGNCDSLTSITIPDSVTSIGEYAFRNCDSLTSIIIGNGVTSIGYEAFDSCDSLTSITVVINNQYYSSDEYGVLFNKDKTSLIQYPQGNIKTSYTIPDSVKTIESGAFESCNNLTKIIIPESVTAIGEKVFYNSKNLTDISVDDDNQYFSNDGYGTLFNKDKTTLICYPPKNERTEYIIPESVRTIEGFAFYNCKNLENITIHDNLTKIGEKAFHYSEPYYDNNNWEGNVLYAGKYLLGTNYSLSGNYKIKNGTTVIADAAFKDRYDLISVEIPDSVLIIGDYAFNSCGDLKSVTLGNSVKTIGDYAFHGISYDANIIKVPKSVESIGFHSFGYTPAAVDSENPFYSTDKHYLLYNKDKTVLINHPAAYYNPVCTIPEGVTTIRSGAFLGANVIARLIIPDTVTVIEDNAFTYKLNVDDYSIIFNQFGIYYTGSEEQWNKISIGKHNTDLLKAKKQFNYCEHTYESTKKFEPTCTEKGYTAYTCTKCGNVEKRYLVDSTGHSHVAEITTPATHISTGVMTYTCHCGDTYTEVIDKIATHNYVSVVTEPTCTEKGYTTYTCECGDTYVADYVDATGHSEGDKQGNCIECGEHICDHDCHKSGFAGFIWKIICFFSKLFGTNKFCECGKAHY